MRREIEGRPLLFSLGAQIIGLTALTHSWNLALLPLLFWLAGTLRNRAWLAAGFALGLLLLQTPAQVYRDGPLKGVARVVSMPQSSRYGWSARAWVGSVPVTLLGDAVPPVEGESLAVSGAFEASRLGGWSAGTLRLATVHRTADPPLLTSVGSGWRADFRSFLASSSLRPDSARLLEALCFGSGVLDREEIQSARDSGWLRLVAASGIQILALCVVLELCFRIIPLPRPLVLIGLTLLLSVYALASGHHAATERAVLGVLVGRWAYLFGRESDPLSALAFAGLVILTLDGSQVYSTGFHLTLVVVGAFILFGSRVSFAGKDLRSRIGIAIRSLGRGVGIGSAASLPILAQATQQIALSGVVSIAILTTVVPMLIAVTFAAEWLTWILPAAGKGLLEVVCAPTVEGLQTLLSSPLLIGPSFNVPPFSGYMLLGYYGFALILWRKRERPA